MTARWEAPGPLSGFASARRVRGPAQRPKGRGWVLALAAFVVGSLPAPVVAKLYSCEDGRGHLILRDVPCKRAEKSRDPSDQSRAAKPATTAATAARTVQTITEAEVQTLVDSMDAATAHRDFDALLAHVSADAVFEVEYRLPQGLRFMRFNKDEYAVYLRDGAALVSGFDHRRENTQIVLSPGSHYAELIATLRETVRVEGKSFTGVTRSKSMVEVRGGRPQITLVRAVTTFDSPEGNEGTGKNNARGKAPGR